MTNSPHVVEVNESDFQQQVIERSQKVPVLVDFWAEWCAPCKMLLPVLLQLAQEYQGKFQLAKVDTDRERGLAQQHGIRSLPTLRLYRHGEVVEEVLGAQPESTLRTLINAHIERESDRLLQQALEFNAQGDRAQALQLLQQARQEDPDNLLLPMEYARLCIEDGQLERAEETLQALPAELRAQPETAGLKTLLEFARACLGAASIESLQASLTSDPGQSETRYQLAARQALAHRYDQALENLLELFKRDRAYGKGAAQRGLLAIFDLLGNDDPRVAKYRRMMSASLY